MTLGELGEFEFIRRFAPHFNRNLPPGIHGIGDDCAVFPSPGSQDVNLLVTTDLLMEGVHFLKNAISPEDLGWKALAVNLSDIAAMGGTPKTAYLSLAVPGDTEVSWLDGFFGGLKELANRTDTVLAGGDTTKSLRDIAVNITLVGESHVQATKFRAHAEPGDVVCLTGYTGESGAGLKAVLGDLISGSRVENMVTAHHRPRPHLEEGAYLASFAEVNAMMDVSDGVDSDLRHILNASGVSARIDIDQVPVSEGLSEFCREFGYEPVNLALTAGEDYCLLACIETTAFPGIATGFQRRFGRPLAAIGTLESLADPDGPPSLAYYSGHRPTTLKNHGFDHFRTKGIHGR